jgi:DNA-binding beta-propeller fold protein YncE
MLNRSDKSVSDIINSNISGVCFVATSEDNLYYTNANTHTVTCWDLHGTTQWEFKDIRVLQDPVGISVDKDGNVYAVGFHSDKVVMNLIKICIDNINKSHLFLLNKNHSIN